MQTLAIFLVHLIPLFLAKVPSKMINFWSLLSTFEVSSKHF